MKVSAQYAQEHFADVLTAIDTGEERSRSQARRKVTVLDKRRPPQSKMYGERPGAAS